ncbi:MAG: ABC transporter substrate-binding protein [Sandaracinaceae bacterium]
MSRRSSERALVWALLPGALLLAACSTSLTTQMDCASDESCQTEFGADFSCGEAGFCVQDGELCTTDLECRQSAGTWASACVESRCQPLEVPDNCTETYPSNLLTSEDAAGTVVFGNLMDRSLTTHDAREKSARLAALLANGAEGLANGPYGFIFCDIQPADAGDSMQRRDVAVASATWLSGQAHVPAIVGPASSGDTQAVFTAVSANATLVISPSATSPALTALDNVNPTDEAPGLLWRTAPPDSFQGATMAMDLLTRGATDVDVIFQSGAYGDGLSGVLASALQAEEVNVQLLSYTDATDRGAAILSARDSGSGNVVFISSSTSEAVGFLNAVASDAGTDWDGRVITLPDAAGNADLLAGVEPANQAVFDQVRGTRPAPASGVIFDRFVVDYTGEYGSDVTQFTFTANAYDAAMMVIGATGWAASQESGITGVTIAQGLRRMSDTSGPELDLIGSNIPAIQSQLAMGSRVNVNGASGPLDYNLSTEETVAPIEVWAVTDCDGLDFAVVEVGADRPACE